MARRRSTTTTARAACGLVAALGLSAATPASAQEVPVTALGPVLGWPALHAAPAFAVSDAGGSVTATRSLGGLRHTRRDLRGRHRWTLAYPGSLARTPVTAPDGTVYVHVSSTGLGRSQAKAGPGWVDAFDSGGRHLWRAPTTMAPHTERLDVDPRGGVVVHAGVARPLISIGSDGARRWELVAGGNGPVAVGPDGTVYAPWATADGLEVRALDRETGAVRWTAPQGAGWDRPLFPADGSVVIPGTDGDGTARVLRRYSAAGELLWERPLAQGLTVTAVGRDGASYAISASTDEVVAIGPDGHERWRVRPPSGVGGHPVISAGLLQVPGDDAITGYDAFGRLRTHTPAKNAGLLPLPGGRLGAYPARGGALWILRPGPAGPPPRVGLHAETPVARLRAPAVTCVGRDERRACRLAGDAGARLIVSTPLRARVTLRLRRTARGPDVAGIPAVEIPAGRSRFAFTLLRAPGGRAVLVPPGRYLVTARMVVDRRRVVVRHARIRIAPSTGGIPVF